MGDTKTAGTPPAPPSVPRVPHVHNTHLNACCLLSQLAVHLSLNAGENLNILLGPRRTRPQQHRGGGAQERVGRTAHLAHAGFPLPAQVSGLLLQPLHFLGMGGGSVLQLSPEVPQLRRQSIHGALGKMGSSDGAAPSFPISPPPLAPSGAS